MLLTLFSVIFLVLAALFLFLLRKKHKNLQSPIEHEWLLPESMLFEVIKDYLPKKIHVHGRKPLFYYFPEEDKSKFVFDGKQVIVDFVFVNENGEAILFVFIFPDSPWGAWHKYSSTFILWLSEHEINFFWIKKQSNYSVGRAKHIVEQVYHMIRYKTGLLEPELNVWDPQHELSPVNVIINEKNTPPTRQGE